MKSIKILLIILILSSFCFAQNHIITGVHLGCGKYEKDTETECSDSCDNDRDGDVDGADSDCESCNTDNDSKIVDNGNSDDSDAASTIAYRARKFTLSSTTYITTCFADGYDGGNGATMACAIYGDDGTTDCFGAGCPDEGNVVVSESSSVAVPDSKAEYEIPFASTATLSAGTYWLVYHLGGTTTGHGWGADSAVNNSDTTYSADNASWTGSNTDTIHGAYGCEP